MQILGKSSVTGKVEEITTASGAINVNANITTATATANVGNATTVTTGGTIAAGCRSVTLRPAAGATATLNGYPLTAGVDSTLESAGALLPALTYTLTGGNMIIWEIR